MKLSRRDFLRQVVAVGVTAALPLPVGSYDGPETRLFSSKLISEIKKQCLKKPQLTTQNISGEKYCLMVVSPEVFRLLKESPSWEPVT